jgi:hypothetical protein
MTRTTRLLMAALCLWAATGAWAQASSKDCLQGRDGKMVCPPPEGRCVTNRNGDVICSGPGGGIELDRYREPLCGPGFCTIDIRGDVFCSSAAKGAASTDSYGVAVCSMGCVRATADQCVKPN